LASKNSEYELAIKIAGKIEQSLLKSLNMTKTELESVSKKANSTSSKIRQGFDKGFQEINKTFGGFAKMAKAAFKTVVVAGTAAVAIIATIGTTSVKAGIEFESAFAGVKKTTEATAQEYEELRQGILGMTREIPASAVAIAEVAEAAGQLGISKENLLDFTRIMIDLGEATNLTATDAATALARFANVTGMDASVYSNLGSSIVALGNNFATTEADIVNMATNLAGAGAQIGMSEADIMGLSAALSSVGLEAAAGGTAMSKTMINMAVAAKTGSENLNDFAHVAGMSAEGFAQAFEADAVGAIGAFIQGLGNAEEKGSSAIEMLAEMEITETRLRDTLLRAGNASELFAGAVELSNEAWKENTALTTEAEQRYETTESKIAILKNGLAELKIKAFDSLKEPIQNIIGYMGDFIAAISSKIDAGAIENLIEGFKKNLPTAIRYIKNFTKSFLEFISPILALGQWCLKNPKVIVGVLVGIGTAIVAYKIAEGIMNVANGFASLAGVLTNPFALAILAISAAIGGAKGIAAAIKASNEEMKKQNLAEHFGDIKLSMEDLSEAAAHILQSRNFDKLNESLNALAKVEGLQNSVKNSIEELNTLNWKVALGLELAETDKEAYISNIESFITDSQEMLTQQQFALSLSVDILAGEGEKAGWIKGKFNEFFAGQQEELAALGTELQSAVNEAFADGLLTIPEIEVITNLQNQMARITEALSLSEFEARMEVHAMEFVGGGLDAESFKNLQQKLAEDAQMLKDGLNETLVMDIANAKVMLDAGSIDQREYTIMVDTFKQEHLASVGDIEMRVANFSTDTIKTQYEEEMATLAPVLEAVTVDGINTIMEQLEKAEPRAADIAFDWLDIAKNIKSIDIDKATRLAMQDLFAGIEPELQGLLELKERYLEQGKEVPQSVIDGITDAATIGALAGDTEAIWILLGEVAADNEAFATAVEQYEHSGNAMPEAVMEGINSKKESAINAAVALANETKSAVAETFNAGIDATMPVSIRSQYSFYSSPLEIGIPTINSMNVASNAMGGIINKPILTTFAEEGPEAAIPLDGSKNAISLWKKAGEILGVLDRTKESMVINKGTGGNKYLPKILSNMFGKNIAAHAAGGIVNHPILTTFAEEGPEAAIPLDGSQNAINLWEKVGRMLGVPDSDNVDIVGLLDKSNSEDSIFAKLFNKLSGSEVSKGAQKQEQNVEINYSPTMNFYGEAPNKTELLEVNKTSQEEFEKMMQKYFKDKGRVVFA
jgi:phage tail tape measure protein, TP901 family, core region